MNIYGMLQNGKNYYFASPGIICPAKKILRNHANSSKKKRQDMEFKKTIRHVAKE